LCIIKEFLVKIIPDEYLLSDCNIECCFNLLDIEKNGFIYKEDLLNFLKPHFSINNWLLSLDNEI